VAIGNMFRKFRGHVVFGPLHWLDHALDAGGNVVAPWIDGIY